MIEFKNVATTQIFISVDKQSDSVNFFSKTFRNPLNLSSYPCFMENQLSEHSYTISDEQALKHLKILMEFTNPRQLRKSVQSTLFAYLLEQDEGSDANYKTVIEDYFYLIEFLDKLDSE
ncbi:hypothetical protein G5B10_11715 [Fluviicola sp. SGL-29]|nr:hypothetical protein [Fluviicola sp. SGL-29]